MSLIMTTLNGHANFLCILMRTLKFTDVIVFLRTQLESGRARTYHLIFPAPLNHAVREWISKKKKKEMDERTMCSNH